MIETLQISAMPHPFQMERVDYCVPAGLTIAQILEIVQPRKELRGGAHVYIGEWYCDPKYWHCVRPRPGHVISIRVTLHRGGGGGGKKSPMRTILQIAVMAAGAAFGPALGLALGLPAQATIFGASIGLASMVGGAVISLAGNYLINAIAPQPKPAKMSSLAPSSSRESQHYYIDGARNRVPKYQRIPKLLGRHVLYFDKIGEYSEVVGDEQYVRVLLSGGYGPLKMENFRIGQTLLENYSDVEIEIRPGYADDEPLTLFTGDVYEDSDAVEIKQSMGWVQRTSQSNAKELSVDIAFPRGLFGISGEGDRFALTSTFMVEYATTGSGNWKHAGQITAISMSTDEVIRGLRWTVEEVGQYDIRVKRTSIDYTASDLIADSYWTKLRTIQASIPVTFGKPLAKVAIRMKASGQLNGTVDEINCDATSILPIWNGTDWNTEAPTSNNAAIVKYILQGSANARPAPDDAVHLASLQEFYQDCEQNGYTYNSVIDYPSSVLEMAQEVAGAGRASIGRPNGLWGVIMDRPKTTEVQHFTPRNSWGFEGTIIYPDLPHAYRVRFNNAEKGWQQDVRDVYDDGYDENNATRFEEMQLPGITDSDLAWIHGRFFIAQKRLRRERYSFYADFEHFSCTRGDMIRINHDVPRHGLASARIKEITIQGGYVTEITIDEEVAMESGKDYAVRIRKSDGISLYAPIDTVDGAGQTVLTITSPILVASAPAEGDLVMFGEAGVETVEALVTHIETAQNESARIYCIDYAPAVYDADTGPIPTHISNISDRVALSVPAVQSARSSDDALLRDQDGSLSNRILVAFRRPSALQTGITAVEARFRPAETNVPYTQVTAAADQGYISLIPVEGRTSYEYQLRYVMRDGTSGGWTDLATHEVVGKEQPPGNVTGLSAQQNGETTTIIYRLPSDRDLLATEIRYLPV